VLDVARWPVEVDVSAALSNSTPVIMRGWAVGPSRIDPTTTPDLICCDLVYCVVGGGGTVAAFDLHVDGLDGYSLAEWLAGQGVIVVAFDHPGVGTSSRVDDIYALDPDAVVRCHEVALAALLGRLAAGALGPGLGQTQARRVIGLGHSMGAMIVVLLHDRSALFDGLVLLGHGGAGLPEVLSDEELTLVGQPASVLRERIVPLARARFGPGSSVPRVPPKQGRFITEDMPAELVAALAREQAELLYACGLYALVPGSISAEMAAVSVPVLLGIGEFDLIAEPHTVVASYSASHDVSLLVLEGSGHLQNQAANRHLLWRRITSWLDATCPPE
jgi:pimeloyl-ACP methyl ester carboxylesterase